GRLRSWRGHRQANGFEAVMRGTAAALTGTLKRMARVAGALAALALLSGRAGAEGALAVGSTGNVAEDGLAIGTAVNYKTREEAVSTALEYCRNYKPAPRSAESCQLIGSFTRECYALAYDPQAGTPGAGWAFGPSAA